MATTVQVSEDLGPEDANKFIQWNNNKRIFEMGFAIGRPDGLLPLPTSHPDPPVVTLSEANGATLLDSPTHVNGTNSTLWRQLGATAARQANTYIHTTSLTTEGSLTQGVNYQTNHVEFFFDGIEFEFKLIGFGGSYRLAVDDMWVHTDDSAQAGPAATGSSYRLHVEFGSRAVRKIRLELATQPWDGVYLETGDSIWATPQPPTRMIVIGDSFARDDRLSGVAAQYEQRLTAFPFVLGQLLGIRDTWASGLGSTGYLATTAAPRVKFRDRLQADVLAHSPDIIVWAGGHNDSAFSSAAVRAEAEACFAATIAALPNCRQFVCSPFNQSGTIAAERQAVSDGIQEAAAAYRLPFLNVLNPLIWSGTGKVGATAGDGNADYYVCNDGIHPSGAGTAGGGHTYLGVRLARLMLPHLLSG